MRLDRTILKRLWNKEKVICLNCNLDYLVPLHKKKNDNNDFQCPNCKKIYRTINIFNEILGNNK